MQCRQLCSLGKPRGGGIHTALRTQDTDQKIVEKSGRDKVEHDRGDDNMAATFGLKIGRQQSPEPAKGSTANYRTQQGQRPVGPRDVETGQGHTQSPQHRLTLTANIEQPGMKSH